ncbi:hypothetical protein BGZ94_009204 [Podila epigama]|nr:hypothetical protein BGZ94_009204 [Podila epigama]
MEPSKDYTNDQPLDQTTTTATIESKPTSSTQAMWEMPMAQCQDGQSTESATGNIWPISPLETSMGRHDETQITVTNEIDSAIPESSVPTQGQVDSAASSEPSPTEPNPEQTFEKWTPPPSTPRTVPQGYQCPNLPQRPLGRFPIPRLLLRKQSLPFLFRSDPMNLSPQPHAVPREAPRRASTDGTTRSVDMTEVGSTTVVRNAVSCDIPRQSIGPPDPIPAHYQHLQQQKQNRRRSLLLFRHRLHGEDNIDRANERVTSSPTSNQPETEQCNRPRSSMEDSVWRRRSSSPSMEISLTWGRLLSAIFVSGDLSDHENDHDPEEGEHEDGAAYDSEQDEDNRGTRDNSHQRAIHGRTEEEEEEGASCQEIQRQLHAIEQSLLYIPKDNQHREGIHPIFPQQRLYFHAERLEHQTTTTTTTAITASAETADKIPLSVLALSPPPSYWEATKKYQNWSHQITTPIQEPGSETLPRYSCTVFKEGCLNIKTEFVENWRPYRRPWKRTFAHLRGTSLRLYDVDAHDIPKVHVRNISLQMAQCEFTNDSKRPHTIRIRACDRTIVLECKDRIDAWTWLEHFQAAANIATSLEHRRMPTFHTSPRSNATPRTASATASPTTDTEEASVETSTTTLASMMTNQQELLTSRRSSASSTTSSSSSCTGINQRERRQSQVLQSSDDADSLSAPTSLSSSQVTRQQQLQQFLQEHQEQTLEQQRLADLHQLQQRQLQTAVQQQPPLPSGEQTGPMSSSSSSSSSTSPVSSSSSGPSLATGASRRKSRIFLSSSSLLSKLISVS